MFKLSYLLCVSAVTAMSFGIGTFATGPHFRLRTEAIAYGPLDDVIDRSRLSEEEIDSLDFWLQRIVNNDKQWQDSKRTLQLLSAGSLMLCGVCFMVGALLARRLEERLLMMQLKAT